MSAIKHLQQTSPPFVEDVYSTVQVFGSQVLTGMKLVAAEKRYQGGTNDVGFQGARFGLESKQGHHLAYCHVDEQARQNAITHF